MRTVWEDNVGIAVRGRAVATMKILSYLIPRVQYSILCSNLTLSTGGHKRPILELCVIDLLSEMTEAFGALKATVESHVH